MMTSTDIGNALFLDVKPFGIATYQGFNVPRGKVTAERIVIHPKRSNAQTYVYKSFAEVNFCVPDLEDGQADLILLNERERQAKRFFDYANVYDGTTYNVEYESSEIVEERDLECHFVNVRILITFLNTTNK